MIGSDSSLVMFFMVAIQVLGIVAALGARISVGSRHQGKCQLLFLAILLLAGLTTAISLNIAPWMWLFSGTSLAVMVLAATCDFGRSRRATAW